MSRRPYEPTPRVPLMRDPYHRCVSVSQSVRARGPEVPKPSLTLSAPIVDPRALENNLNLPRTIRFIPTSPRSICRIASGRVQIAGMVASLARQNFPYALRPQALGGLAPP